VNTYRGWARLSAFVAGLVVLALLPSQYLLAQVIRIEVVPTPGNRDWMEVPSFEGGKIRTQVVPTPGNRDWMMVPSFGW